MGPDQLMWVFSTALHQAHHKYTLKYELILIGVWKFIRVFSVSVIITTRLLISITCHNTRWIQWFIANTHATDSATHHHARSMPNYSTQGPRYESTRLCSVQTSRWTRFAYLLTHSLISLQNNLQQFANVVPYLYRCFCHFRNATLGFGLPTRSSSCCTW